MTIQELINYLNNLNCPDSKVTGFVTGFGDFNLKPIKYINSKNNTTYVVITDSSYNPKSRDTPDIHSC